MMQVHPNYEDFRITQPVIVQIHHCIYAEIITHLFQKVMQKSLTPSSMPATASKFLSGFLSSLLTVISRALLGRTPNPNDFRTLPTRNQNRIMRQPGSLLYMYYYFCLLLFSDARLLRCVSSPHQNGRFISNRECSNIKAWTEKKYRMRLDQFFLN